MPRPWKLLDTVATQEGSLELRQRGEGDFMISIGGRVLMSSVLNRSEVAVAELGCAAAKSRPSPRVLIGGLGLGFTLRAALDALPASARVVVAELNPVVVAWCRGPVAALTDDVLGDPRVEVVVGDVTEVVRARAVDPSAPRFDAIILDLYVGPGAARPSDPLYGRDILRQTHEALSPGGVYAVWGEDPSPPFERRLTEAGFAPELVQPRGGGPRHAVYVAVKRASRGSSGTRAPSRIKRQR